MAPEPAAAHHFVSFALDRFAQPPAMQSIRLPGRRLHAALTSMSGGAHRRHLHAPPINTRAHAAALTPATGPLPSAASVPRPVAPATLSPPSQRRVLTVSATDGGMRLDRWLRSQAAPQAHLPVSLLEKLCRSRQIHLQPNAQDNVADSDATGPPPKLTGRSRVQPGQAIVVPAWLLTSQAPSVNGAGGGGARSLPPPSSSSDRAALSDVEVRELRSRVLHEDAHLLVLNKPPGLAVHAGTSNRSRHLSAMLWALHTPPLPPQPPASAPVVAASSALRLVHRLDKETSGCLMLAKDRRTAETLSDMLKQAAEDEDGQQQVQHSIDHSARAQTAPVPPYSSAVWDMPPSTSSSGGSTSLAPAPSHAFIQKRYLAIVHGVAQQREGSMVSASETGSLCHSSYRVLASTHSTAAAPFSLLELLPHTGRKRQLRLHCHAQLGCSIVGEQLRMLGVAPTSASASGPASAAAEARRQQRDGEVRRALGWSASAQRDLPLCLHAHQLLLCHPTLHGGSLLHVHAPLPPPFAQLCRVLFDWQPAPLQTCRPAVAVQDSASEHA